MRDKTVPAGLAAANLRKGFSDILKATLLYEVPILKLGNEDRKRRCNKEKYRVSRITTSYIFLPMTRK